MIRVALAFLFCFYFIQSQADEEAEPKPWAEIEGELQSEFASASFPDEKRAVIRKFGEHDRAESASFLLRFLTDRKANAGWREEAIQVLSEMKSEGAQAVIKEAATSTRTITRPLLQAYIAQADPEARLFLWLSFSFAELFEVGIGVTQP